MADLIQENDFVIIERIFDPGNLKIVNVIRDNIIKYGKLKFEPSGLIGQSFGTVFEINNGFMEKLEDFDSFDQGLSSELSDKMTNYEEKSEFSREKLIKKKKRKNYANVVSVIRPNLLLIHQMLYARDKLGGIRKDIFSQIITSANLRNGSKCLILDHNLGIVTAATMSRILPDGKCVQLIPDNEAIATTRSTLGMLNIRDEDCNGSLFAITLRDYYKVYQNQDNFQRENEILQARGVEHLERLENTINRATRDTESGDKVLIHDLNPVLIKRATSREARNEERIKAAELIKSECLDSLIIIAQSEDPLPILKLTIPKLANSGQFVVYCDFIEPLLDCHQYLKSESLGIFMTISEPWLRPYQVLPDRTRPDMNVLGFGGFILSGTKVSME